MPRRSEKSHNLFIGQKLKNKRKNLKMTQKDLASMVGVTFQQLQKYESGQTNISISMLIKLCESLSVTVNYFFPTPKAGLAEKHDFWEENNYTNMSDERLENVLLIMFREIKETSAKISMLKIIKAIIKSGQ
jgi:transcriptional regulator with XRE-family HTH domain